MNLRPSPAVAAFALCGAIAANACGSSSLDTSTASPQVYTGAVDGTDARLAVIATAHHARFFFCGGGASYATSTHWFTVDLDASGAAGAQATGFANVAFDARVQGSTLDGHFVLPDGTSHDFHAQPVAAGTLGGLYEADGPCGKIGFIVDQKSADAAPAAQGACVPPASGNAQAVVEQVTPLRPLTRASDGTIRVLVGDADNGTINTGETVAVHAAAPPAP